MAKLQADAIVASLEASGEPFEAAPDCPWLYELESAYGVSMPEPFRSLVEHYRWAEFEVGPLRAFSNLGARSEYDLLMAPFADKPIASWLRSQGLLQIGRLSTGSYDPVCLELAAGSSECPVVRVDHEDILLCRKRVRVTVLAPSFEAMVHASAL
jgi:hypothetical protein